MSSEQSLPPKQTLSLDKTPDNHGAEMGILAGGINNALLSKPLSQDSGPNISSEVADLSSLVAQMTNAIGNLVTEAGETNRILKVMVAEKHTEKERDAGEEMEYNPVPISSLRSTQAPLQETEMERLRDTFLVGAGDDRAGKPLNELVGHVSEPDYSGFFLDFDGAMLIVRTDETGGSGEGNKTSNAPSSREVNTTAPSRKVLKISEALALVRSKWPLNTVSKDEDKIIWRVINGDLWDCRLYIFDKISNRGLAAPEYKYLHWPEKHGGALSPYVSYSAAIYRRERS